MDVGITGRLAAALAASVVAVSVLHAQTHLKIGTIAPDGTVALPVTNAGAYALVYPDKASGLAVPPLAQTGAALTERRRLGKPGPHQPHQRIWRKLRTPNR